MASFPVIFHMAVTREPIYSVKAAQSAKKCMSGQWDFMNLCCQVPSASALTVIAVVTNFAAAALLHATPSESLPPPDPTKTSHIIISIVSARPIAIYYFTPVDWQCCAASQIEGGETFMPLYIRKSDVLVPMKFADCRLMVLALMTLLWKRAPLTLHSIKESNLWCYAVLISCNGGHNYLPVSWSVQTCLLQGNLNRRLPSLISQDRVTALESSADRSQSLLACVVLLLTELSDLF